MHKMATLPLLLSAALMVTGLSGCLVEEKLTGYHAYGSNGSFAAGFAYEGGKSVLRFDGPAYLDVNDENNTGAFVAKGKVAGKNFHVIFEDFAQSKPFHDGGIAADFHEHGASGVGDMTIPEVDLEMAGWGLANIKSDGVPYKDPISGKDQWTAHFMVIRNGVRDNTTGAIYADANKSKPYSPMNASMGYSEPGDYELHLVLRNQTGNGTAGAQQISPITYSMVNAQVTNNHRLFEANALGATAQIDLVVRATGAQASNLTFTLLAPGGSTIATKQLGAQAVAQATQSATQVTFPVGEFGDYTVRVTGRVAPGGSYEIRGVVTPPPSLVMNLWWEDVIFGEEAEAKGEAEGLLEGTRIGGEHAHAPATPVAMPASRVRRDP